MKLEHSSQLMEHCKDKLPTPAGLWFFVLLYPTFITYINSLYRLFWPTQQSSLCLLSRWDFFINLTKTDINRDVASLHWHKTTTNFTYYCISAWMELAGRQVKTPERLTEWERNDSFFVLPAVMTSVCSWAKHLTSSIQLHWTLISKLCMTTLL